MGLQEWWYSRCDLPAVSGEEHGMRDMNICQDCSYDSSVGCFAKTTILRLLLASMVKSPATRTSWQKSQLAALLQRTLMLTAWRIMMVPVSLCTTRAYALQTMPFSSTAGALSTERTTGIGPATHGAVTGATKGSSRSCVAADISPDLPFGPFQR